MSDKDNAPEAPKILKPIASTSVEGGTWYAWTLENLTEKKLDLYRARDNKRALNVGNCKIYIHAIKFSDGRVWDCVNGWREVLTDG